MNAVIKVIHHNTERTKGQICQTPLCRRPVKNKTKNKQKFWSEYILKNTGVGEHGMIIVTYVQDLVPTLEPVHGLTYGRLLWCVNGDEVR